MDVVTVNRNSPDSYQATWLRKDGALESITIGIEKSDQYGHLFISFGRLCALLINKVSGLIAGITECGKSLSAYHIAKDGINRARIFTKPGENELLVYTKYTMGFDTHDAITYFIHIDKKPPHCWELVSSRHSGQLEFDLYGKIIHLYLPYVDAMWVADSYRGKNTIRNGHMYGSSVLIIQGKQYQIHDRQDSWDEIALCIIRKRGSIYFAEYNIVSNDAQIVHKIAAGEDIAFARYLSRNVIVYMYIDDADNNQTWRFVNIADGSEYAIQSAT